MRRLALFACALVLAGCEGGLRSPFRRFPAAPPGAIAWRTSLHAAEPQRVAVLPFALAEGVGRGAAELGPALAASLRALALHEVVLASAPPAGADLHAGSLAVDTLAAVREATGCDAVVVGRIEHFDGYHPVSLGAAVHLVSCADGAVLWSAQLQLDGRREEVQRDIEGWWRRGAGEAGAAVDGWRSVLSTPRDFCRYAADRLAWTVANQPPDSPR